MARDGEGRVSHRIILARDMTGRKLFEQELVESHQELRSIFHALPDSYFRLDADGRYLDYKPGLGTAPPFGLGDPLGRLPTEVFPGPTGERIMAALELVRAGRGSQALEYALTSGGQERFFEARLAPMGQRQAVCLVREITKYKLAALAVGEREANYRALVDSCPWRCSSCRRVSWPSPAGARWICWGPIRPGRWWGTPPSPSWCPPSACVSRRCSRPTRPGGPGRRTSSRPPCGTPPAGSSPARSG